MTSILTSGGGGAEWGNNITVVNGAYGLRFGRSLHKIDIYSYLVGKFYVGGVIKYLLVGGILCQYIKFPHVT